MYVGAVFLSLLAISRKQVCTTKVFSVEKIKRERETETIEGEIERQVERWGERERESKKEREREIGEREKKRER
jgi:hypothetical protein